MPIAQSFLDTCTTSILLLPELTTFRTAYALYDAASQTDRPGYWADAFDDAQSGLSPAYRLRKAIRDIVRSTVDATISPTEREEAYRTLTALYVPDIKPPRPYAEEAADLQDLLTRELLS